MLLCWGSPNPRSSVGGAWGGLCGLAQTHTPQEGAWVSVGGRWSWMETSPVLSGHPAVLMLKKEAEFSDLRPTRNYI